MCLTPGEAATVAPPKKQTKMKRNNIQAGHRTTAKGNRYANRQARRLFSIVFAVFGLALLLGALVDHSLACAGGTGLSFASMLAIGNIDDVSDKDTHGSDISYIVYLISVEQIDRTKPFPQPNGLREVSPLPLLPGQVPHYFEAHDIPTFTATTEKGDITTTGENVFTMIMGGARVVLYNFIEQYSGGKFVLLFKHVKNPQWYIVGELERPLILNSTETKDDKDGRYTTLTFKRPSVDLPLKYAGNPAMAAAQSIAPDAKTIAVKPTANSYTIANGTTAGAVIDKVSGLTAADKGRYITLLGAGTDKPATIADSLVFVLEDAATWTAKEGAAITFRVLDANTLVEVSRTA